MISYDISMRCCRDMTIVRFFSKAGHHSMIQLENSTRLRHGFLEMLARPETAHFCLKFSKNKLKLRMSSPVVDHGQRMLSIYFTQDQKYLRSMGYGVRLRYTIALRSVRGRFTCNNSELFSRLSLSAQS